MSSSRSSPSSLPAVRSVPLPGHASRTNQASAGSAGWGNGGWAVVRASAAHQPVAPVPVPTITPELLCTSPRPSGRRKR